MEAGDAKDLAKLIWDYMLLKQKPQKASAIIVLGSHDTRVAEYAADLFRKGLAPLLVVSGKSGAITKGKFGAAFRKPEAEVFADVIERAGVPREKILIESESRNTGENVRNTKRLLLDRDAAIGNLILVHKPYMERRTYATMKKVWPGQKFVVTSPRIPFDEYIGSVTPANKEVQIMIGDLQRIKLYARKGYQIPQTVPDNVWQAFELLKMLGYDKHLASK